MTKKPNWIKISRALEENFLTPDFGEYSSSVFSNVSFKKALEIFRYIIELRTPDNDESTSI
ncbi:MAG: hypothetical protein VYB38_15900 [Bacteroidota bacterium]|nr:hypothetical protein [Bacteroidota bacterium]